ncbi:MAG: hypothetical protein EOS50_02040 [Mesorhizobium sp.]|uniref:hypothetical protein n=1 Tax=Mesorhizobium sp. TaxID=1871066 RepID=UPI000FE7F2E8|nr:hypothetical protein [Mesorhizobium sp.]RWB35189.1 MAG: hypothetical protein EOQ41_06400 [Mesorhizobium sp.]RWD48097.1 MAG: hypothetical protein EOS35_04170 [Mesorhizobium sp.]RWF58626.1 MAG: hypothetical protein EOS50_02040 [Mesorhizobium sp.]TIT16743.1 MAG: hypothetical protein E5W85_01450 [Mesorhizobium sp.]
MDSSPAKVTSARRGYWLSLMALVVALPAALAAQTWGSIKDWRSQHLRQPVSAILGQPIDYAGASWTVTRLIRLAGSEGSAVVLAEFEALAADPKALGAVPCKVRLSDGSGREWQPTLFADPVVRKQYPDVRNRSLCGGTAFAATEPGKPARMAASFLIPPAASSLTLSIALYSALPNYLSVSEPRT